MRKPRRISRHVQTMELRWAIDAYVVGSDIRLMVSDADRPLSGWKRVRRFESRTAASACKLEMEIIAGDRLRMLAVA